MSTELAAIFNARLLTNWLNQRFDASLSIPEASGEAFVASDGDHSIGIYIASLWETNDDWDAHLRKTEARLSSGGGA